MFHSKRLVVVALVASSVGVGCGSTAPTAAESCELTLMAIDAMVSIGEVGGTIGDVVAAVEQFSKPVCYAVVEQFFTDPSAPVGFELSTDLGSRTVFPSLQQLMNAPPVVEPTSTDQTLSADLARIIECVGRGYTNPATTQLCIDFDWF